MMEGNTSPTNIHEVYFKDPSGNISFVSRSEAAKRLRQVADRLENDPAVDMSIVYWIDTNGSWELTTEWDPKQCLFQDESPKTE